MAKHGRLIFAALLFMLAPKTHAEYALTDAQRAEVTTMIEMARLSWCADIEAAAPEARDRGPCAKEKEVKVAAPAAVAAVKRIALTAVQPASGDKFSDGTPISRAQSAFLGNTGQTVLDDPVDKGQPRFELTTTTQSSRAGIRWGRSFIGSDGVDEKSFTTLAATLSAPVSKTGDDTNIATLDGFANASTLALNFTRFNMTGFKSPSTKQLQDFVARAGLPRSVLGSDPNHPDVDLDTLQEELRKIGKLSMYRDAEELFFRGDSLRWTYGANATVGYESDDYFNATTLAAVNQKATPWSAGVYAGFFPRGTDVYMSTGFDFAHSYKLARVRTICPASAGSSVACVTGSFGPPTETDKHLLWLSARNELATTGIGLGIKITHDLKSGDSGVELPIYLFRDDKHLLNGGVRVGWTNTDHFAAGLFVGSSFDVTGN